MKYPYTWSLLGLLYYPAQQAIYYSRFGSFNLQFSLADVTLALVGVLSFAILFTVLNMAKSKASEILYWLVFIVLGIPLSLVGSVGGGMLGYLGSIVFGVVPVLVVLLLAKGILLIVKK